MPFIIEGRRQGRLLAGVAAALALTASPAVAATTTTTPLVSAAAGCETPLNQSFLSVGDSSTYYLSPGGDVEGSMAGWSLAGGAKVVPGSAPAVSGGEVGKQSVAIPSGGSITTAPVCIAAKSPYFRFQARNTGAAGSGLRVEVLYLQTAKATGAKEEAVLTAAPAWAATPQISLSQGQMGVNGSSTSQATIAFRLTALGTGGAWQVDDVYIDPYRRF